MKLGISKGRVLKSFGKFLHISIMFLMVINMSFLGTFFVSPVTVSATGTEIFSDGVGDVSDNCVNSANENQLDDDPDGIGSACDAYLCIASGEELCGNNVDEDCNGQMETCESKVSVTATKIVCPSQSDLPDWGGRSEAITSDTANIFLSEHENCHLEPNWYFQWSNTGQAYYDDNLGVIDGFNTSEATKENGQTTFFVDSSKDIAVREVMQDGYLRFSGVDGGNDSAEMWCGNDIEFYDNYDFIVNPEIGNHYYCVAFNVATTPTEPTCDYSVSGTKYNGNREQTMAGWEIQLFNGDTMIATTSTNIDGNYSFADLCAGDYSIHEVVQRGWRQVSPYQGGDTKDYFDVTLGAGDMARIASLPTYDFFNEPGICGYKYNSKTEAKVAAWPIYLKSIVKHEDSETTYDVLSDNVTGQDGEYCFFPENGSYRIEEMIGGDWEYGDWTVAADHSAFYDVNLAGDEPVFVDFWNTAPSHEAVCGDGLVEGNEVCDDGEANGTNNHCDTLCQTIVELGSSVIRGTYPGVSQRYLSSASTPSVSNTPPAVTGLTESPSDDNVLVLGEEGAASLHISKKVNTGLANPGDILNYTITVNNSGKIDAYKVVAKDTLPDGFVFADGKSVSRTWELGDLAPGATKDLTFSVMVKNDALTKVYTNTATVSADNQSEQRASVDVEVNVIKVLAETGNSIPEFSFLVFLSIGALLGARKLKENLSF